MGLFDEMIGNRRANGREACGIAAEQIEGMVDSWAQNAAGSCDANGERTRLPADRI